MNIIVGILIIFVLCVGVLIILGFINWDNNPTDWDAIKNEHEESIRHLPSRNDMKIMRLINDIGNLRESIADPLTPKEDVYKYTEKLIRTETELNILEKLSHDESK